MPVKKLELLAPARNKDIGIAAIDCGADAVYIAGPSFGAREAAGNSFEDIAVLTDYAHRFGAKVYLTLNTIIYGHETEAARQCVLSAVKAGCDALIIQDLGILKMNIPPIELHASTQCNIRTPEQARWLASLGFRKIVLARELSSVQIREISEVVPDCEIECFVHGALCVCYSGQCYLSQYLTHRSANRGCCIQACRSLYDVMEPSGKLLLRGKAILSLKDLSLKDRLLCMAEAGASSFKIEGRLKNISYVRNIVRAYSDALDSIISGSSGKYARSSWGSPSGGFSPHPEATFNRGYTRYFIDGTRGKWNSGDYAKGIGEPVGEIISIRGNSMKLRLYDSLSTPLANGDGLCFVSSKGDVSGMRADTVQGSTVTYSQNAGHAPVPGTKIYRSYNHSLEKAIENNPPERLIPAVLKLEHMGVDGYRLSAEAAGGRLSAYIDFTAEPAQNRTKTAEGLQKSLSKRSGIFTFTVAALPEEGPLPFLPSSSANALRRDLAMKMEPPARVPDMRESIPLERIDRTNIIPPAQRSQLNCANPLARSLYNSVGIDPEPAFETEQSPSTELMRCKYCIRYELGLCPKQRHGEKAGPLILINNGRRLKAVFDCARCEMVIIPDDGNGPAAE